MTDAAPLGHIKLARKAFDLDYGDAFWLESREFSRWEAWVDLIQMAAWRDGAYLTQSGKILLARGEFVASRRHLAKRWNWSEKRVRHWFDEAQNRGPATPDLGPSDTSKGARLRAQRETPLGMVYLIVNYDTYQSGGTVEVAEKGPAKGPATSDLGPSDGEIGAQERSSKAVKAVTTLSDSPDVRAVLEHFLALHPRRRVSAKDAKIVAKALALGYSRSDLCEALDGNAADEWHRDKKKHELSYVLRDTGKIDGFRVRAELADEPITDEFGCLTAYGERITRPANV